MILSSLCSLFAYQVKILIVTTNMFPIVINKINFNTYTQCTSFLSSTYSFYVKLVFFCVNNCIVIGSNNKLCSMTEICI